MIKGWSIVNGWLDLSTPIFELSCCNFTLQYKLHEIWNKIAHFDAASHFWYCSSLLFCLQRVLPHWHTHQLTSVSWYRASTDSTLLRSKLSRHCLVIILEPWVGQMKSFQWPCFLAAVKAFWWLRSSIMLCSYNGLQNFTTFSLGCNKTSSGIIRFPIWAEYSSLMERV